MAGTFGLSGIFCLGSQTRKSRLAPKALVRRLRLKASWASGHAAVCYNIWPGRIEPPQNLIDCRPRAHLVSTTVMLRTRVGPSDCFLVLPLELPSVGLPD